jgi:cell division protein FtsZ|tara:strand:+ start:697 stop:1773 length:1077 start_codon:yes stop_codon:yes gene_type:complete
MVQERLVGFGTANIKVFGVGGGGGNAINRMYKDAISGIEFIAVNTDNQALENSLIPEKIRIGDRIAKGMGVGGDPSRGKQAAEENRSEIKEYMDKADMVFIASGMGGGSGTGAAPVIAEIARNSGALTIGVVTKPFGFEGTQRLDAALEGIENLKKHVDTLIVVPNDRLLQTENNLSMSEAFNLADDVLKVGIQSISELILVPGEINLDFADVKTIMENAGPAWMGIGESSSENRAVEAAERAVSSPLLEMPIDGAKGVIFNVSGGKDITLDEVTAASEVIKSKVHPEANIIFGSITNQKLNNKMKITVIATGFPVLVDDDFIERNIRQDGVGIDDLEVPPFLRKHPSALRRLRSGTL